MHVATAFTVFGACLQAVQSAPTASSSDIKVDSELRLVKTSEDDAGQWVTEQQKFELFTSKRIGFVDITDIKDEEVLAALSGGSEEAVAKRAVTYPTTAQHQTEANALITKVNTSGPQSWLKTLSDFYTRHYKSTTGVDASNWLFNQVKMSAQPNPAITVRQFTHSRFNQPSIIATLPGQTSNLVIVGAHMDSTGGSSTARSPGADDNGSGSVTILEALRVLAASGFKPKNTLEFHWYAGEEGGLLGSADVFANYKQTGKTVLAMLNQDMTAYSPSGKMAVFTDNVDSSLTQYVRVLSTAYVGVAPLTSKCGYGCSDHASARSNGFPSAFVNEDTFEASNPYIHSAQDSLEKVQWPSILRHAKFTVGFLVEASYI